MRVAVERWSAGAAAGAGQELDGAAPRGSAGGITSRPGAGASASTCNETNAEEPLILEQDGRK